MSWFSGMIGGSSRTFRPSLPRGISTVTVETLEGRVMLSGDSIHLPPHYPSHSAVTVGSGDFNGDGKVDLVTGSDNGIIRILINNGDGTFRQGPEYAAPDDPFRFVIDDFNGDGRADIIANNFHLDLTTNKASLMLSMLMSKADGGFDPVASFPISSTGLTFIVIASGDFNGDGSPDLAVTDYGDRKVSILLNSGKGEFVDKFACGVGGAPNKLVAGDIDGDGITDLVVINSNGTVDTLLGNGDGTFQPRLEYPILWAPGSLALGDFNRDGKVDLAIGYGIMNVVSVMMNRGDGTFASHVEYPTPSGPTSILCDDMNGDGRTDLVTVNQKVDSVSVYFSGVKGTFSSRADYAAGPVPGSIVSGDFNGDGLQDLAVTNYWAGTVSVLMNLGSGVLAADRVHTFDMVDLAGVAQNYGKADAADVSVDFNGDGGVDFADLVIVAQNYGKTVLLSHSPSETVSRGRTTEGKPRMRGRGVTLNLRLRFGWMPGTFGRYAD